MKSLITIIYIFLLSLSFNIVLNAQSLDSLKITSPKPKKGWESFYEYASENVKYSENDRRLGLQGQVIIEILISKRGKIKDVINIQGFSPWSEENSLIFLNKIRAQKNPFSKWQSGTKNGKKVDMKVKFHIEFKLK